MSLEGMRHNLLNSTRSRYEAPQEPLVAAGQEKGLIFSYASQIHLKQGEAFDFRRFLPHQDAVDPERENTWARTLRAIFEVAREHPELSQELGEMEGMIIQDPQMIHPRHLIGIASDVIWDPRIHGYLKSTLVHGLGYAMRFFKETDYESAIAQRLDFASPERFSDTARFLEFMQNLYNIGDEYSYNGDNVVVSRVRDALREAVEKEQGNYLLNVRAQELLADMDGSSFMSSGFDRLPFEIVTGRYACHKEDGLYVSAPADSEHIKVLIKRFEAVESQIRPPQHLIDEAIARGDREVWWTPNQNVMRDRNALYEEIYAAFSDRLTLAELSPEEKAGDPETRASEEHDFAYLQRKPLRETIKRDFEIELSHLSLQDQYKLLKVLKTVEYGKATPLLLEATGAMWRAGVRNYLQEVRGASVLQVNGPDIPQNEREELVNMLQEVYEGKYPEEEIEELRGGLQKALQNPSARFFLYRKDGELLNSVRFEPHPKGYGTHMGSFMTNPRFGGGALGQALLSAALEHALQDGPVRAICDPEMVPFYEKFGFHVERGPYKDKHGVETCDIVLEPDTMRQAA